jgi:hypothetical protein
MVRGTIQILRELTQDESGVEINANPGDVARAILNSREPMSM